MDKIYYSADGYWKGYSAVSKLSNAANVSEDTARKWLEKQAIWQIYLQPPDYVPRPHWDISKPNEIHQADLLFLPHDTVKRKTYKYALVVVDVASRYTDAEPLTSKYSTEVAKAFDKMYSRKMKWPNTMMVDPGTEFMGELTKVMNKRNIRIQRGEKGNHKAQSLVERANRTIAEKLFSHQYAQEMLMEVSERSREWAQRRCPLL
jgi:hypothetical protein